MTDSQLGMNITITIDSFDRLWMWKIFSYKRVCAGQFYGVIPWVLPISYHLVRSTMAWSYNCKLCLILVWIGVMCTAGHCQRFPTTTRVTSSSTPSLTVILSSISGTLVLIGICTVCCVFCICLAKYEEQPPRRQPYVEKQRRRAYSTPAINQQTHTNQQLPLPQHNVTPESSSGHWQQTMAPTTNQDNTQTVQESRYAKIYA